MFTSPLMWLVNISKLHSLSQTVHLNYPQVRGFARSNLAKKGGHILEHEVLAQVQDNLVGQKEIVQCACYVVQCARLTKNMFKMECVVFLLTWGFPLCPALASKSDTMICLEYCVGSWWMLALLAMKQDRIRVERWRCPWLMLAQTLGSADKHRSAMVALLAAIHDARKGVPSTLWWVSWYAFLHSVVWVRQLTETIECFRSKAAIASLVSTRLNNYQRRTHPGGEGAFVLTTVFLLPGPGHYSCVCGNWTVPKWKPNLPEQFTSEEKNRSHFVPFDHALFWHC